MRAGCCPQCRRHSWLVYVIAALFVGVRGGNVLYCVCMFVWLWRYADHEWCWNASSFKTRSTQSVKTAVSYSMEAVVLPQPVPLVAAQLVAQVVLHLKLLGVVVVVSLRGVKGADSRISMSPVCVCCPSASFRHKPVWSFLRLP